MYKILQILICIFSIPIEFILNPVKFRLSTPSFYCFNNLVVSTLQQNSMGASTSFEEDVSLRQNGLFDKRHTFQIVNYINQKDPYPEVLKVGNFLLKKT